MRKFTRNNPLIPADTQPKFKVYNWLTQHLRRQMTVLCTFNVDCVLTGQGMLLKFSSKDQH